MPDDVATYKGRPAHELTREELIEAFTHACREIVQMRETAIQDAKMHLLFSQAERDMRWWRSLA